MSFFIYNRLDGSTPHGPYTTKSSADRRFKREDYSSAYYAVIDLKWREREKARKNLIDLSLIGLTPITDHFLFVSKKLSDDEGTLMVSYTQDEARGRQDRQAAPQRIGRYLAANYPTLSSDDVRRMSATLTTKYVKTGLKFAKGRKAIRDLYRRCAAEEAGVTSCMTHDVHLYSDMNSRHNLHPVEAYGGPDLQVAYILKDGKVVARALVWPANKSYGRVYGDSDRLVAALQALGYRDEGLLGARLLKIQIPEVHDRNYYVAPYIDTHSGLEEHEDYLVISNGHEGREMVDPGTAGVISWPMVTLADGRRVSSGLTVVAYQPSNQRSTRIMASDRKAQTTDFDGLYYLSRPEDADHWIQRSDGTKAPRYWCVNHGHIYQGVFYRGHDVMQTRDGYVPRKVYFENYAICEIFRQSYRRDNMVWMEHGAWWSRDALEVYGRVIDGKNYANEMVQEAA